ncbi:MAG: galactokinase, partial [Clostridia bacterium]|nr:galactokinase [Clostridia bacterium]
QYAENEFFGKPCGLMDQVASATGGIVAIDFKDANAPQIEKISFDLTARGYALCIIKTGGSHADLTEDYAAIPKEMKSVAKALGHEVLAEASEEELLSALPTLRETLSDRAILRAIHFFEENKRVTAKKAALESGDLDKFLSLVKASGLSSFCYLQNVYSPKAYTEQKVSLALCLSELYLGDKPGAWRVHGGGFAGTIQAFLPTKEVAGFKEFIDGALGVGATTVLSIRNHGALKII